MVFVWSLAHLPWTAIPPAIDHIAYWCGSMSLSTLLDFQWLSPSFYGSIEMHSGNLHMIWLTPINRTAAPASPLHPMATVPSPLAIHTLVPWYLKPMQWLPWNLLSTVGALVSYVSCLKEMPGSRNHGFWSEELCMPWWRLNWCPMFLSSIWPTLFWPLVL